MVIKAQDVIITNNDDMLKVYNLEIGKNMVFYQMSPDADAAILKMPKSEIFIIKMQDGSKIDPNASDEVVNTNVGSQNNEQVCLQNQQLIKKWNDVVYKIDEPLREKKSIHNPIFVKLGVKSNSQLCNEDLTLHYSMSMNRIFARIEEFQDERDKITLNKEVSIQVTNNTSQMLYIDLSQSFYTGKQKVLPMYSGKTVTNTSVGTTGISFGLIGGASTSAQTTTTTEQKILPIPPHGTITLPYIITDPLGGFSAFNEFMFANPITQSSIQMLTNLAAGESKCFEENETNVDMYISLAYSNNEQMQNIKVIRTDFYLQQILKLKACPAGYYTDKKYGLPLIVPQDCNSLWFITCDHDNSGGFTKYEKYSNKP